MKNIKLILVLALCFTSVALASFITGGYGKKVSATATAVRVDLGGDYVHELSVLNDGTVDAYAAVNVTLAVFTNAVIAGTTVVIPAGAVYTFSQTGRDPQKVKSYCYSSASGTNTLYVGGY